MTIYERTLAGFPRRELLKLAWRLGAGAIMSPLATSRLLAAPTFDAYPFQLGVASGDPMPDGVVLWTRLAPRPLEGGGMPQTFVGVEWEVARDPRFASIAQKGIALARPELAHSVHVEVAGLEPARDYWYRFRSGDATSAVGRTRTAPAAGARVDRMRFAVCGCNNYEDGYYTAFKRIAEEQFDFVFHTGDYIYEGGIGSRGVRRHNAPEAYTLADYRNRYALYKTDPDLIAAHLSAPFIVTWDDHEVSDNYAGDVDARGTAPEIFILRRAAAYQAYFEHMPLRAGAWPTGSHMRVYRRLQFGNLIDLNVLDTRQWRSDQACGDGLRTGCVAALARDRTMMGVEQERWLFDNLADARSRWTVIGQQVPTYARDMSRALPDGAFAMDQWDGYVAARTRLYDRLLETRAPNPIVLSGDVHMHFGGDLKTDFTDPRSTTVGVEFTNSSITSIGDGLDVFPVWEAVKGDNPHIKYHSGRRGYIACTATETMMRADFKIIDKVSVADLPAHVGGSLVVEAGKAGSFTD
jgi:alkaline phosphatase D